MSRRTTPAPTRPDPRLFVNSIEKGMAVLELFETARQDLSLTDIVARTDLGRSAAQRFVHTLHELGYLSRDPATRRYSLGPKVLGLYRGYVGGRSMLQLVRPALAQLGQQTREAVAWVELLEKEIIVVDSLASPHLTSVTLAPGMRFEAISSSSGQVLLAHASEAAVELAWAAATPSARERTGARDVAGYARLLERVRRDGFALTEKAFDQDSLSISAPALDVQHRAIGAINLSTLRARFDVEEAKAKLVPAIMEAARGVCP